MQSLTANTTTLFSRILLATLVVCVALYSGSAHAQVTGFGLSEATQQAKDKETEGDAPSIEDTMADLDLRQRISQLMFVRLEGLMTPSTEDRALMKHFPPGGVLIPTVTDQRTSLDYVEALKGLALERESNIGLLIAARLETAMREERVRKNLFSVLPTGTTIGAVGPTQPLNQLLTAFRDTYALMGFNTLLAPPLELSPTLSGAMPAPHTLGTNPDTVAKIAAAYVEAFTEADIICAPTGFPGGGANRTEPGPAVLLTPDALLADRDMAPFTAAIAAGANLLHVGNTLVPMTDPNEVPASMSPNVIQGLLRNRLGFDGIVLAGPMDDGDILTDHTPVEAALGALHAGADMLYWRDGGARSMRAVEGLLDAVKDGRLSEETIDRVVRRVLEFKQEQELLTRELPKRGDKAERKHLAALAETIRGVQRHSITLVKNAHNVLPLTQENSSPIGVTGAVGVHELHDALEEHLKSVAQQPISTAKHLGEIQDFEITRLTLRAAGLGTAVCVFPNTLRPQGVKRLIGEFRAKRARVVVILLGYPELIDAVQEADAILLAYDDADNAERLAPTLAQILVGHAPLRPSDNAIQLVTSPGREETLDVFTFLSGPAGRLPVTASDEFPAGHGLSYSMTDTTKTVDWDFGDGQRAKGLQVTHAYAEPGEYTLSLHAETEEGDECTAKHTVTVR